MTSKKMNVEFRMPEFGGSKIVIWKCHVSKFTNSRYAMIIGRYLLTALGLDLEFYETLS